MTASELVFSCIEQRLKRGNRVKIAADAWQVVVARFHLCPQWDGLTVYARFFGTTADEPPTVKLEGRACVVPWEAICKPGEFEVAIFGEGENGVVLTSSRVTVPVYPSVKYDEYPPVDYEYPEPTPSLLQSIEQKAAQAAADAQAAREAAERAEAAGGTGGTGGAGINGFAVGTGLVYDKETNTLSVDTADSVEKDNTRPVTSAAVFTELGGLSALLATI